MLEYYIPTKNQSYLTMLSFEEMDLPWWRNWFSENWLLSLYIAVGYVITIFAIQYLMRNRQEFNLRPQLAAWNFIVAAFSVFAFSRFSPELFHILIKDPQNDGGLYHAACKIEGHGMSMAFWAKMYAFSKIPLLLDTLFIVLRKRKLLVLHWYHHSTVLVLSWYTYLAYIPLLRFVGTMNYFVHIFMYTYYGLKALEIKVPKIAGPAVTILELLQMLIGLFVTFYIVYEHNYGDRPCSISLRAIMACAVIYSTLFVLFMKFFQETVIQRKSKVQ